MVSIVLGMAVLGFGVVGCGTDPDPVVEPLLVLLLEEEVEVLGEAGRVNGFFSVLGSIKRS